MRKLTRVDFLVCHLLKNRFSFFTEVCLKLIFGTQRGGVRGRGRCRRQQCGRVGTKLRSFRLTRSSQEIGFASVPLSNELQHLPDGDCLTFVS